MGAFSLFIVLSGFAGLKDFSLQFTNVFDSDLKVYPAKGKTITFSDAQRKKMSEIEGIQHVSEIIEERIFLQYKGKNHIAYIKGVDAEYGNVTVIDSILFYGEWFVPDEHEVVVGLSTIAKLSMGVRDYSAPIEIYVPRPGSGQINMMDPSRAFSKKSVIASGVYQVNEDLDGKYLFADIDFARNLLSLKNDEISSLEIKLMPKVSEEEVRNQIESIFPEELILKNRIQQNDALYKMLNTENIAVYLIFTLVLIIALFNVIGSIIIMILDKRKNIKTLYNMGATLKGIRQIFFLQGTLMTVLGGILGVGLGIIAVAIQLKYHVIYITHTLPYPAKLELINAFIVLMTISVLGIIAAWIASSRVREKLVS